MYPDQPATPSDAPPAPSRPKRPKLYGPGRPRVLDDAKRREICALIAGGFGFREAARYVNCSTSTLRREAERNPEFAKQLRDSEAYAQLHPLHAMQRAVATHWRAAAWFLERTYPERFGRRQPKSFSARQARELMNEVLKIVRSEIRDIFKADRVEDRVRAAFEYHICVACDENRDHQALRRAMKHFDNKNRISGPLADLGIPTPDFDDFFARTQSSTPKPASTSSKANQRSTAERHQNGNDDAARRSRDPVPNQTAGSPANGHATTSESPPPRPQGPPQPQNSPARNPRSQPSSQAKTSFTDTLRAKIKKGRLDPKLLRTLIRDLAKQLGAPPPKPSTPIPAPPDSNIQ